MKQKSDVKNIQKTLSFSPRQAEMVEMIKNELGFSSFTGAIGYAISEQWRKVFPSYKSVQAGRVSLDEDILKRKAEFKIKMKEKTAELEFDRRQDKKIKICKRAFFGEPDETKTKCVYTIYSARGEDFDIKNAEISLSSISEELAENNVFSPDKQTVLELRPGLYSKLSISKTKK